jgi:hypothetical protein
MRTDARILWKDDYGGIVLTDEEGFEDDSRSDFGTNDR